MEISGGTWATLKDAAEKASKHAYAEYSGFKVGAAVLTESGEIFSGCNVENASYGLTSCAERNAIFQAVSKGHRKIKALVVYTPTQTVTMPCGACRQVILEFGRNVEVLATCESEEVIRSSIKELLPLSFGIENL
jgi:cytidine deaminase